MKWREFDWVIVLAISAMIVLILMTPALERL